MTEKNVVQYIAVRKKRKKEEGLETKYVLQRHGFQDILLPTTTCLLVSIISQKCHQIMNPSVDLQLTRPEFLQFNSSPKVLPLSTALGFEPLTPEDI